MTHFTAAAPASPKRRKTQRLPSPPPSQLAKQAEAFTPPNTGFIYLYVPGLAAPPAYGKEGKVSAEGSPAPPKSHFPHIGSLTQPNPPSMPLCRNQET